MKEQQAREEATQQKEELERRMIEYQEEANRAKEALVNKQKYLNNSSLQWAPFFVREIRTRKPKVSNPAPPPCFSLCSYGELSACSLISSGRWVLSEPCGYTPCPTLPTKECCVFSVSVRHNINLELVHKAVLVFATMPS